MEVLNGGAREACQAGLVCSASEDECYLWQVWDKSCCLTEHSMLFMDLLSNQGKRSRFSDVSSVKQVQLSYRPQYAICRPSDQGRQLILLTCSHLCIENIKMDDDDECHNEWPVFPCLNEADCNGFPYSHGKSNYCRYHFIPCSTGQEIQRFVMTISCRNKLGYMACSLMTVLSPLTAM